MLGNLLDVRTVFVFRGDARCHIGALPHLDHGQQFRYGRAFGPTNL